MSPHLALLDERNGVFLSILSWTAFFAVTLKFLYHLPHTFYSQTSNPFTMSSSLDPPFFQEIHYDILDALVRGMRAKCTCIQNSNMICPLVIFLTA